jgi:hypothetical protein
VAAAARAAFRRHFLAEEGNHDFSAGEQALLHCLLSQPRALPPPTASGIE